jgi:endonuclease/exonuclease/phosphatase family metal-dependent hydrolase
VKLLAKIIAYPLLAVNIIIALLVVFSCYGSLLAPIGKWPFASLSGLAFPFLFLFNIMFLILWLLTWKKGALVPLATILICLVPTLRYFPLHLSKSRNVKEPYITVVTYNTEGFGIDDNKDWTLNNPVLNYILELDADLVFIQEAPRDVINKASRDRKVTSIYPYVGISAATSSEAYFSKYPVTGSETINFENSGNGCLYLKILVGSDTLAVYNCHLQSNKLKETEISEYQEFIRNPTDSTHYKASKKVLRNLLESTSLRAGQARLIADRARKETAGYMIVCGDFNDTPLSYSHHVFNRFMTDAYAKSGVGMGITYHEHKLYYRIDHIFCSRNITPLHTWIDRTQKDSDHYPVISRIRLN